eukprot:8640169-Alexandrium_andersonii.AAC.1
MHAAVMSAPTHRHRDASTCMRVACPRTCISTHLGYTRVHAAFTSVRVCTHARMHVKRPTTMAPGPLRGLVHAERKHSCTEACIANIVQ